MKGKRFVITCGVSIILMLLLMQNVGGKNYRVETITVHKGDVMLDYAKNAPSMNPYEYVYEVKKLNGKESAEIKAGERLKILVEDKK